MCVCVCVCVYIYIYIYIYIYVYKQIQRGKNLEVCQGLGRLAMGRLWW